MRGSKATRCFSAFGLVMLVALPIGGYANAQEQSGCTCLVPLSSIPASGEVGALTKVAGQVLVWGANGPQAGRSGVALHVGDTVSAGPDSSASFKIGSCSAALGAEKDVSVASQGKSLCVAIDDSSAPSLVAQHSQTRPGTVAPGATGVGGLTGINMGLLLGGLGLGTFALIIATQDDDEAVSPVR